MLNHCGACLVAHSGARSEALALTAHGAGFGSVSLADGGLSGREPLLFFLLDGELGDGAIRRTVGAVRAGGLDRVRLAPLVLFINDCPFEQYLHYVHMGLDDVITLPEKGDVLIQRLENQLGEHLYFRTPTYLGPDRRRFDLMTAGDERRGKGPSDHERVTFLRSALTGIQVLRTLHHVGGATPRAA